MTENKICVRLYGDGSRDAKLRAEAIYCDRSDVCSAYVCGKCFNVTSFLTPYCPFGRISRYGNHTKRAKAYAAFRAEVKNDPVYAALDYPSDIKIVRIGDDVLIRLHYISWNKCEETIRPADPGFYGGEIGSIKIDKLTPGFLGTLIDFRPRAMMGGIIEDYQRKEIPIFLYQLQRTLPEVYERLKAERPEVAEICPNFIGMWAKLCSLSKDATYRDHNGNRFRFSGQDNEMVCEDYHSAFLPFECQTAVVKVKVSDKAEYKIDDNSQVTEDTVFV
ncbi:MAG: hypothetical protein Q4F79_13170 [Eubacteriales bacterium]|nr:hypothetical protein [Eubacteriales bacterium]